MRGANFVSFFTVWGFFIGIIFALLKSSDAESLFLYTLLVTIFFHLFAHISVAFYFRTLSAKSGYFPVAAHEKDLDIFAHEIDKREQVIESIYKLNSSIAEYNAKDT